MIPSSETISPKRTTLISSNGQVQPIARTILNMQPVSIHNHGVNLDTLSGHLYYGFTRKGCFVIGKESYLVQWHLLKVQSCPPPDQAKALPIMWSTICMLWIQITRSC